MGSEHLSKLYLELARVVPARNFREVDAAEVLSRAISEAGWPDNRNPSESGWTMADDVFNELGRVLALLRMPKEDPR